MNTDRRRRLSDEQYETIVSLREKGWSYSRIGRLIGCSESSVSYHCLKLAAEPPKPARCWDGIVGPATMLRNGHEVRRFTPEDDATLLELEGRGEKIAAIARAMKRRPNSIRARLMTLARREERKSA